ncbi:MAG: tetratricopeptide repeat protein [Chloroherpetonaceae bacterium]
MTELEIQHLLDSAHEHMRNNALKLSQSLFSEALTAISTLPDSLTQKNLFIRTYSGLSFCLSRASEFVEAEETAARAVALLGDTTPYDLQCNAYYFFALAKYYLSQFSDALPLLQKSYALAEANGDDKLLGRAANTIANIFFNLGDYHKATEFYQISLSHMRRIDNQSGIAMALNNIGVVFRTTHDLKAALEVQMESLNIRRHINETSGIAMSLNNIANIYSDMSDHETALAFAKESLSIHEHLNDDYGTALSLNIVARCLKHLGDTHIAFNYHWQSLLLRLKIKDRFGEILSYLDLGELYAKNPSLPCRFPPEPSAD